MSRQEAASALAALGLPHDADSPLLAYVELLEAWAARINLTGGGSTRDRVRRLVGDVAPASALLEPGRLIDVGSGNGSPGLVLALLRPDLRVTLLEPRARRWAFLREACRRCGRPEIEVVRARHDGYGGPPGRTVTLRAVRVPAAELVPLLEPGGRLLVFGGEPAAAPALPLLGTHPLPGSTLHVFQRST